VAWWPSKDTYPDAPGLPENGVQRGSIVAGGWPRLAQRAIVRLSGLRFLLLLICGAGAGDPLTPGWPSNRPDLGQSQDDVERVPLDDSRTGLVSLES
jgi:hypothetical protein